MIVDVHNGDFQIGFGVSIRFVCHANLENKCIKHVVNSRGEMKPRDYHKNQCIPES